MWAKFRFYRRGFGWGILAGGCWLIWIYRRTFQFPGDPELNRYYAWLRRLS